MWYGGAEVMVVMVAGIVAGSLVTQCQGRVVGVAGIVNRVECSGGCPGGGEGVTALCPGREGAHTTIKQGTHWQGGRILCCDVMND